MNNTYRYIENKIGNIPCPFRLYPARLKALDQFAQSNTEERVINEIVYPIAIYSGEAWAAQFMRDFQTYGLMEAIVYFHTYGDDNPPKVLVDKACQLYSEISDLYIKSHDRLIESDNPRVQVHLSLLRHLGDSAHQDIRSNSKPLEVPDTIASPTKPIRVPGYQRRIPIHRELLQLIEWLGGTREPGCIEEELIENLQSRFTFEGFSGLNLTFFEIAQIAQEFGINIFSSSGQYILQEIIENINDEMFGGFDQWVKCQQCDGNFMPEVELHRINKLLINGGWICDECQKDESQN